MDLAADLYPRGPADRSIWTRSGGDLAALTLGSTGWADWFAAVSELRRGGGGTRISVESLLREMASDYSGNPALGRLLQAHNVPQQYR